MNDNFKRKIVKESTFLNRSLCLENRYKFVERIIIVQQRRRSIILYIVQIKYFQSVKTYPETKYWLEKYFTK